MREVHRLRPDIGSIWRKEIGEILTRLIAAEDAIAKVRAVRESLNKDARGYFAHAVQMLDAALDPDKKEGDRG
jgi:hypothetical protein